MADQRGALLFISILLNLPGRLLVSRCTSSQACMSGAVVESVQNKSLELEVF